jgi:hypothetical protein
VVTDKAPHVAIGLAVCGIGTIAAAWDPGKRLRNGPPRWLPLPIALGIALVSLSLWHQSESDRVAMVEETTKIRADRVASEVIRRAAPMTAALQRLADAERARRSGAADIEPQVLAFAGFRPARLSRRRSRMSRRSSRPAMRCCVAPSGPLPQ